MGKKRQLFVSSVETFRDGGTPKAKTRYDRHGNVVGTTHYDEKGHPLSGICGDFMKWEMLDSHTIKISGNGDMDDFTTMASPPWQMHEITLAMILSILVDTFISKISFPMQPGPEIGSISDA